MENTIVLRVFDFLSGYPPFSLLERATLLKICEKVVVQYRRTGEVIFEQGAPPVDRIFVVREGAVHLYRQDEGDEERQLVEQCDEGDLFGLRPLLADRPYALTAETVEESLIYAIDIRVLKPVLDRHPKAALYLAGSFAADYPGKSRSPFLSETRMGEPYTNLTELQAIEHSKAPVTGSADETIQTAAQRMSEREVGSLVIVDERRRPIGIITDKDLRKHAATGQTPLTAPVARIMSKPVITIPPNRTAADVQMAMVRHGIHHLCITEDGTDQTAVAGVLSEHDLLVLQGANPAVLIRRIRRCASAQDLRRIRENAESLLRKYIYQEVNVRFISSILSAIDDAINGRAIELALAELSEAGRPQPAAPFCWLTLGSGGRQEQLLRTDQDNALVFGNVAEADTHEVKAYYLALANKVNEKLYEIGFEFCPADMMARNPAWCLSLSEWKRQFSNWIDEPTPKAVMLCTIFFDYRPVYGDQKLSEQLTKHIFTRIGEQSIFLSFLARDALQNPPPLTFFRRFVVEKSGEHQDAFDIKRRAIMPLTDAARTLILSAKISHINNTAERYEKLAELEPQNRELYEQAAAAYELLMRYRTLQGLKNDDSGRYFDPTQLSKIERLNLRNSFAPIRELQQLLRVRFQLSFMT